MILIDVLLPEKSTFLLSVISCLSPMTVQTRLSSGSKEGEGENDWDSEKAIESEKPSARLNSFELLNLFVLAKSCVHYMKIIEDAHRDSEKIINL